jgi:hypothetical protein
MERRQLGRVKRTGPSCLPPMHEGKIETPSRAPGPRRGFPLLGFRPQFDYVVRRRLIPVPSREQPAPLKKNLVQRNGLSNDVQHAIGQRLRAEYALDRSLPSRIARLLSEFEQRNGTEAIASTRLLKRQHFFIGGFGMRFHERARAAS